jgi:diguanylate cyclase (GGDEF)-like protein
MPKNVRRHNFRLLSYVAFGLITLSVLAIGQTIWSLREDAIQEAATNTGNVAVVLSEQLARSIQSVDIVLTDVRERAEAQTASAREEFDQYIRSSDLHEFLRERLSRLSQADFIAIIDRDGHIATTTQHWITPKTDSADRDYFQHFSHETDDRIYISNVSTNRVTGARTIFVSKRINGPNGEFLGVVLVGLGISYFQSIYDSITPLHDQSFALLHPDGTILVRYPTAIDRSNQKMPAGSPWYTAVAAGGGHYWSPGFFDGQARLVAVQPLHHYPLVINVAVSEAAALAHWYRRATLIGIGTLLALLCSAFLLKLLSKQLRRLLVSEAALARREVILAEKTRELQQANSHLDAALQNISQGLCMFDSDGRLVICNERYLRMYNLSADVIKPGCDLLEMIEHRTQRGTFTGDAAAYDLKLRSAARNKERINLTVELEDGRAIEVVNRPTADGGWVATHAEITERKRYEAKIAHLAHHDVLTGLPNRAAFNEVFATTLERARSSCEQFALVCLDLDRFKYVNDGHAVGDALLCEVAKRLKATIGSSFLARIGGDEFTVIVSGVQPLDATARLAERIVTHSEITSRLMGESSRQMRVSGSRSIRMTPPMARSSFVMPMQHFIAPRQTVPAPIGSSNPRWIASCANVAGYNMTSRLPSKRGSSNLSINPKH